MKRLACALVLAVGCSGGSSTPDAGSVIADAALLADAPLTPDAAADTSPDVTPAGVAADAQASDVAPADAVAADAASVQPDAAPVVPDAAPLPPDVAPAPDVAPPMPDAMVMGPTPDAMVQTPDAGPAACVPGAGTCPVGSFCSNVTRTCLASSGALHFTFTDLCIQAGPSVGLRLFDVTHGGVWPSNTDAYVLPYGQTKTLDVSCIPGAKICFGANGTGGALFWGVSLSNDKPCVSCCTTCDPPSNVQPQNLLCN